MSRAVIGVPLCNGGRHAAQSVGCLLAQTYDDFFLVLVDDASTDGTATTVGDLVRDDPRAQFFRNEERLGMVGNWKRCAQLARELHPELEFFAWGSDHDVWDPAWLEGLVQALDENARAVLAYPLSDRIDENAQIIRAPSRFQTQGIRSPTARLWRMSKGMGAGSAVYGLYRVSALFEAGIFRRVLGPDRLLLTELAFRGEFVQVERVLWHRRATARSTRDRQRMTLFRPSPPWYARLPPNLTHTGALFLLYVIRGHGSPEIGRVRGLELALVYATGATLQALRRASHRLAKRVPLARRFSRSLRRFRQRQRPQPKQR